jgi:hypothetical protein
MRSSDSDEAAYETASTTNGAARARPKERSADRRAGELDRRLSPGLRGRGGRKLPHGHDGAQGTWVGGREERRPCSFDEGDQQDRPEDNAVGEDRNCETPDREDADAVGPRSSATCGSSGQPQRLRAAPTAPGRAFERRPPPCLRRRAGDGEHEQRVRDRRRLRPEAGKQLPGLEQHEVAVSTQRNRAHIVTLTVLRR